MCESIFYLTMSNEINSRLNNISTTEHVFEQFQSGAMYEDGKYITLNELVSPSHAQTEVIDTNVHLPAGEAEISSTMQRKKNPLYYKSDLQESNVEESKISFDKVIQQRDLVLTPAKIIKKRGRKKKIVENKSHSQIKVTQKESQNVREAGVDNNSDLNYDMIIEEDNTAEQLLNYSTTKKFTKVQTAKVNASLPRKRGRPPKSVTLANKKEGIEMSSDIKFGPNVYQNKKIQYAQRGRKQKNNSDTQPLCKSTNNLNDLTCVTKENNTQRSSENKAEEYENTEVLLNEKQTKKLENGGKKKKLEKLPPIKISKTKSKKTYKLNNKSKSLTQEANNISIVAKRKGRPKKLNKTVQEFVVDSNMDMTEKKEEDCLDNLCLSKLKESIENDEINHINHNLIEISLTEPIVDSTTETETSLVKNHSVSSKNDVANHIDVNVKNNEESEQTVDNQDESLLEESNKRPVRRRIKKTLHYEEEPDDDPFANMESSDDEPRKSKKGNRYYSDDEYIPGLHHGKRRAQFSDSEIEEEVQFNKKPRKKKLVKSPKKKDKKCEAEFGSDITIIKSKDLDDDIEGCLETSVIKLNDDQLSNWGTANELENFLAKKIVGCEILIKKAKSDNVIVPLQIPVIDPNEPKKCEQISTQTESVVTKSAAVQTDSLYDVPMKKQIKLTAEQSDKACEFLCNIVRTTAELGQLMTQKSEDFIEKKINTTHVTDTFKMDYCVKKSFLLFKLAKHNLIQMEEDLAQQYDEFLKDQNLMQYREEQKTILSKNKDDSDSDCEIIEVLSKKDEKKEETKPTFNPKTVFLNKELSIKIAKKSSAEPKVKENLNVKGRHTVWINDSIMVKKVKPNQSFLAQDSRNKKPPDTFITLEMVNNFFKIHSRQRVLSVCAPFITADWSMSRKLYTCSYFTEAIVGTIKNVNVLSNQNPIVHLPESQKCIIPKSLLILCMRALECCELTGSNDQKNIYDSIPLLNTKPRSSGVQGFEKNIKGCTKTSNLKILKESILSNHLKKLESDTSKKNVSAQINQDCFSNISPKPLGYLCMLQLESLSFNNGKNCSENKFDMVLNKKSTRDTSDIYGFVHTPPCKIISLLSRNLNYTISNDHASEAEKNRNEKNYQNLRNLDASVNNYNPESLLKLCMQTLEKHLTRAKVGHSDVSELVIHGHKNATSQSIYSLKALSLTKIINFYFKSEEISLSQRNCLTEVKSLFSICVNYVKNIQTYQCSQRKNERVDVSNFPLCNIEILNPLKHLTKNHNHTTFLVQEFVTKIKIKKLSRICLEFVSSHLSNNGIFDDMELLNQINYHYYKQIGYNNINNVESLKKLSLKKIITLMEIPHLINYQHLDALCSKKQFPLVNTDSTIDLSVAINDINTVSDNIFNNDYNYNDEDKLEDDCDIYDNYENDYEENPNEKNEWMSQIRMEELRSGTDLGSCKENSVNQEEINTSEYRSLLLNVKKEPADEPEISIHTTIKIEPVESTDDNQSSLEIITKIESFDPVVSAEESIELINQKANSYDVDVFEAFVATNKLMYGGSNFNMINDDEIYSQSNSRIRRQFEPDFNGEVGNFSHNMDLLVPQNVEEAKDRLMRSSSDDEKKYRKRDTKKSNKRKVKLKKYVKETQLLNNKQVLVNDVTKLTKKMKSRIRQEYNSVETSDTEDVPLIFIKDKDIKISKKDKEIDVDKVKNISVGKAPVDTPDTTQQNENEIQCNNVDSTENSIEGNTIKINRNLKQLNTRIRNVMSDANEKDSNSNAESETTNMDISVELLEYETTLSMFDSSLDNNPIEKEFEQLSQVNDDDKSKEMIIRNGWECYPINNEDLKIYQYAHVGLEKLPESFVETYFQFIDIEKNEHDKEISRLTNLQTLHKTRTKEGNRTCMKKNTKDVKKTEAQLNAAYESDEDIENVEAFRDKSSLSADEGVDTSGIGDAAQARDAENGLAKSLLMNEGGSDSENAVEINNDIQRYEDAVEDLKIKHKKRSSSNNENINKEFKGAETMKIKQEPYEKVVSVQISLTTDFENVETLQTNNYMKYKTEYSGKTKPGPKSKTKTTAVKREFSCESVLLTADRMMHSELALLQAPPTAASAAPAVVKETKKKPATRNSTKYPPKDQTTTVHIKRDDDSSSEEEKQWVTTKEKLLKRLERKQDNNVDDAKRAKIVSEFIEKRGEEPVRDALRRRPRRPRSRKKLLERRKQMKVLSRELFGEDSSHCRKSSGTLGKGRRNIRKVIDKKSLARGTVLANMQEFERKQRLAQRHSRLKEALGCEQEVNVVVINDELCLEYDFERNQPFVSVHPYFTKVMKDHQYEGVKFMWDACFDSVETVQRGIAGGGCILAHCMGLGKTLQVLALLHTVMMHPLVAMRRVLVCCPLSTVLNWVDEIHKWFGPVTDQIKVFELSKLKKTYERAYQLEDWHNGGGIFIVGYELFRSLTTLDPMLDDVRPTIVNKIRTALLDPGPDMIICDEGHLLKNDVSVLAVAMSRVITKRRIILTGTPMQNNLREYYCMVKFVKPDLLGTYAEYSNRFENPIMNGQHRDSRDEDILLMKTRTHILHKVLEGCLQRQEASVLYPYLPKKYEYTVFISLTTCQWDLYRHYMRNYARETKQSVLKDFHVLQKIWSHPRVLHNFQTRSREVEGEGKIKAEKLEDDLAREDYAASEDVKPSPTDVWWLQYLHGGRMLDALDTSHKFLVVFRLLDECAAIGDKVLIFSTSLFTLDALEYFLRRINGWSLGQQYYRLDGSVPAEVRQKWCREFNEDTNNSTKLFLISTRAGCLGLNMTAANRVIILDTSWNPAHDIQSIFRVYRFGQKKDCYIYRLVALGTMEQKMYERSVTKQAVACRVVDEQQIDRHYNSAELSELYRYDEEGVSVGAGLAAGVQDAVLLRVAGGLGEQSAALHAVREHDSLLRDTCEARLPEHERAAAWKQFQQEHETKQMQSLELKKPKKPVKQIKMSAKSTPTQPKSSALPPRATRGKSNLREASDENTPSTSKQSSLTFDPRTESTVIQKIRDILIAHRVTASSPEDMSRLIMRVREYIAVRPKNKINDPVITSIASVLLGFDADGSADCEEPETIVGDLDPSRPVISDSNFLDIKRELLDGTDNIELQTAEKRRRTRRNSDAEYVPTNYRPYSMRRKQKFTSAADDTCDAHLPVGETARDTSANDTRTVDGDLLEVTRRRRGRLFKKDIIIQNDSGIQMISTEANTAFVEESLGLATKDVQKTTRGRPRKSEIQNRRESESQSYISESNSSFCNTIGREAAACGTVLEDPCGSVRSDHDAPGGVQKRRRGRPNKCKTAKRMEFGKQHIPELAQLESRQSEDIEMTQNNKVIANTPTTPTSPRSVSESTEATRRSKRIGPRRKKYTPPPAAGRRDGDERGGRTPAASQSLQRREDIGKITTAERGPSKLGKETERRVDVEKTKAQLVFDDADVVTEESILLSDDDDVVGEGPPPTTNAGAASSAVRVTAQDLTDAETVDDITPLPKSLLTDSNFIKIVAHMYVSGNPMLDEDAALLAAQYSTLKAFKEVESTGVEVGSGPLYDIALKVYGKDGLVKLHNVPAGKSTRAQTLVSDTTARTSDGPATTSADARTSRTLNKQQANEQPKNTRPKQINTQAKKIVIKNVSVGAASAEGAGAGAGQPAVVPVGLFRGAGAAGAPAFGPVSREESILPDDDAAGARAAAPGACPPASARRSARPLIVHSILSDKSIPKGNLAGRPTLTICNGKLVLHKNTISVTDEKTAPVATNARSTANAITKQTATATKKTNGNNNKQSLLVNTELGDSKLPKSSAGKSTPPAVTASFVTINLDSDDDDDTSVPRTTPGECRVQTPAGAAGGTTDKNKRKIDVMDDGLTSSVDTKTTDAKQTIGRKKELQKRGQAFKVSLSQVKETKGADVSEDNKQIRNRDSIIRTVNKSANGTLTQSLGDIEEPSKKTKISKIKQWADALPNSISQESVGLEVSRPYKTSKGKIDVKELTAERDITAGACSKIDNRKTCQVTKNIHTEYSLIDLTDADVSSGPDAAGASRPAAGALTGASKDIFITSSGTLSSVKAKCSSSSVDLTGGYVTEVIKIAPQRRAPPGPQGAAMGGETDAAGSKAISKINENIRTAPSTLKAPTPTPSLKRPSPHVAAAGVMKKKKTESRIPLTLRDFNLDDFDDIVELE